MDHPPNRRHRRLAGRAHSPRGDTGPMSARADDGGSAPGESLPLRGWHAALVAAGGGLLGAAAFPQLGWWWAAPIACGALSVAVHGQRLRRSAWLGFVWGLAFFLPL